MNYAPYPRGGTLGFVGAASDVIFPKGWGPSPVNLTAEFTAAQGRAPTAAENAVLAVYRDNANLASKLSAQGVTPQNQERNYWTALGLAEYYLSNLVRVEDPRTPPGAQKPAPGMQTAWQIIVNRGNDIVNKKVEASKGFFSKVLSAVTHAPIMMLVNPADGVLHKIVGDKVYYSVAKAVGGDKVEAALKAGNHSLSDLSKSSTQTDLVKQGIEVAKVAVQEKLAPEQINAVLASLPAGTAQAARDALAGKTLSASAPAAPAAASAQAQLRTLDPPKRPAAAPAPAPLRTLDPPKRVPAAQTLAPPQKATAPASPSAGPVQPSAVAPGVFVYAPYPPHVGALNDAPGASSEVRSPTSTSTEVRSPTSTSTEVRSPTSTSTEAYTQGNFTVTVTGGAGAGATNVNIEPPPLNRENTARSRGAPKNAHENTNINAPRPSGPTAQENKSVNASGVAGPAFSYSPYPGALSGPPPDCLSLGPPITDMDGGMHRAGLSAVNGSGGRSRMVHGPDGKDYLFALEGGALVARQCFSEGALSGPGFRYAPYALNAPPPPHGGHGGGHGHGGAHHFSHGGGGAGHGGRGWRGGGPWNYVTAVQTCRTWGDPIVMFSEMATAAQEALNASGGRPTTVLGPDGVLYLLAIENGAYTARPCAAVA